MRLKLSSAEKGYALVKKQKPTMKRAEHISGDTISQELFSYKTTMTVRARPVEWRVIRR
jgi:hypothetical protein